MDSKTVVLSILLYVGLALNNSWARKPIVPDQETMEKVHQEISTMVQEKEYNYTEDLSLYSCYGKIHFKDHSGDVTRQLRVELENSGITVERLKVNQTTNQSYMIISIITHDTQELKQVIAEIFSSKEYNSSVGSTALQAGLLVPRDLGCTELSLR